MQRRLSVPEAKQQRREVELIEQRRAAKAAHCEIRGCANHAAVRLLDEDRVLCWIHFSDTNEAGEELA